jgi:pantetheine-phosphate adenylyltransferase
MRAFYPGTFDPITNGHLDIIIRSANIFEHLTVGVIDSPNHSKKTLFSIGERIDFIEKAVEKIDRQINVVSFHNLAVDAAKQLNAHVIVRGLRAVTDFEYELQINQLNRHQAPDIESVFFMTEPENSFISSSGCRELAKYHGRLEGLVSLDVEHALREKFASTESEENNG